MRAELSHEGFSLSLDGIIHGQNDDGKYVAVLRGLPVVEV